MLLKSVISIDCVRFLLRLLLEFAFRIWGIEINFTDKSLKITTQSAIKIAVNDSMISYPHSYDKTYMRNLTALFKIAGNIF